MRKSGFGGDTGSILASLNGTDLVSPSELSHVSASDVSEIRYLTAANAAQQFGTRGTMGPVIVVTLKRG